MIDNPYSFYETDQRNKETIELQSDIIKSFCDRNILAFTPLIHQELSFLKSNKDKKKESTNEKKGKTIIFRMDFDDGRYIEYRDNIQDHSQFEMQSKVVVFINGVPGGIKYFRRIEKVFGSNFCRVINLYIPGLDRKDERRGTYQGSLDDIVKIIDDFLQKLNIQKATFILHSFGGLITKYFAYCKPNKVESIIQIASIPITKWRGFKLFENLEQSFYDIDFGMPVEELYSEEYRHKLNQVFNQTQKDLAELPKDQQKVLGPVLLFSIYDVISLMKIRLSLPGQLLEIIHRIRQVSKSIPRMIVYSSKDDLIESQLVEEEIYEFIVGENATKRIILNQRQAQPTLDKTNFCANYIFRFDDSSHNVHHEKGKEIGVLAKHFIRELNSTQIINQKPNF